MFRHVEATFSEADNRAQHKSAQKLKLSQSR